MTHGAFVTTDTPTTSTVEAAAVGRRRDYLNRRASDATPEQDWTDGFKAGARWTIRTTAALAAPEFRQAIAVLAETLREPES